MKKSIIVSEEVWLKLQEIKLKEKKKNIDEVVADLLKLK